MTHGADQVVPGAATPIVDGEDDLIEMVAEVTAFVRTAWARWVDQIPGHHVQEPCVQLGLGQLVTSAETALGIVIGAGGDRRHG